MCAPAHLDRERVTDALLHRAIISIIFKHFDTKWDLKKQSINIYRGDGRLLRRPLDTPLNQPL